VVAVAVVVVAVGFQWGNRDATAMTTDATAANVAAEHWMIRNVAPTARVLADDTFYVDLVKTGFRPQLGVVWFYKLDFTNNLDPSVERALPGGYREFDYVISTPVIRNALAQNPGSLQQVRQAVDASTLEATFGTGSDQIQIRRLIKEQVASPA
jgi:hypothetical protein